MLRPPLVEVIQVSEDKEAGIRPPAGATTGRITSHSLDELELAIGVSVKLPPRASMQLRHLDRPA